MVYGEDVTYSVCQFNQMFSKGARIYVVVTPGQTFSVTLSGGDGHTIFRWGTGSSIKL